MTAEQNEEFEKINICWICGKLIEIAYNKARDYSHMNENDDGTNYRGAAHWSCNINSKISKKVPVIFHNLRGYDSHLLFKELSKFDCKMSVISNGLEKYMSFTLNINIVFIDSMLIMNSSLDKLARNLSDEDFKYLSRKCRAKKLELVKKKDVYPYEYFDSFKRFGESKLPDINCFFSSLKYFGISEKEYERAINVWKDFGFKNLGEYHDLYLKTDVSLLCNVFEKFISVCLKNYGLDPSHYFSSPGLSWDTMLKMTGVQLEKINNIDIHLFLEKGMRGDVSYISKRYSKSNENTDIMCWDMNNLYGTIMSFDYLPCCGFKFLTEEEIKVFDLDSIPGNSLIGYILEVDLECPTFLDDLHNDYPLYPEKIEVSYDMLSKYCKDIADRHGITVGGFKKLIPSLGDKVQCIVHYRNLKYHMSLKLVV